MVTSLGRVFEYYVFVGASWEPLAVDVFSPPFAGTTMLTKGDGYGCLVNRDGLLACQGWCNPGVPYPDNAGCAGFRAGTKGLNLWQSADSVRVFLDPTTGP